MLLVIVIAWEIQQLSIQDMFNRYLKDTKVFLFLISNIYFRIVIIYYIYLPNTFGSQLL